ncbi:hypothetical protein K1719_018043 [Acacia pycnantha]|nr:hypothetical protein K1719_018043 [Acacia pycnantha]
MGRQPSFGFMNEDYMEALTGGPWVISDAYLSASRWRPEFNPKNAKINSVIAWVRFPDLPAQLFDKKFLLNLGNSIGREIRLDVHTAQRARGKFARMCVELDLTKPLVLEFNVEGQLLSVVYESIGQLYNKCGRVGHMKANFSTGQHKGREDGMEVEEPRGGQEQVEKQEEEKNLWRTVQRPRRQRGNVVAPQVWASGSNIEVLHEVPDKEE